MLSILGSAASWSVLNIPWFGPKATLFLLYLALAVIVIGGPAGAVWIHMNAKSNYVLKIRDAEWKTKLAAAKEDYNEQISQAETEAEQAAIPVTDADVVSMCGQYPTYCRDGDRSSN